MSQAQPNRSSWETEHPFEEAKPQWERIAQKITEFGNLVAPVPEGAKRETEMKSFEGQSGEYTFPVIGKYQQKPVTVTVKDIDSGVIPPTNVQMVQLEHLSDAARRLFEFLLHEQGIKQDPHDEMMQAYMERSGAQGTDSVGLKSHVARFMAEPKLDMIEQQLTLMLRQAHESPQQVSDAIDRPNREAAEARKEREQQVVKSEIVAAVTQLFPKDEDEARSNAERARFIADVVSNLGLTSAVQEQLRSTKTQAVPDIGF